MSRDIYTDAQEGKTRPIEGEPFPVPPEND